MRIDEFKRTPDGTIGAADRTRLSCVGFDIPSANPTPAVRRGGDSFIIHHGRLPALPPVLEPQPYVIFETGLTSLTLFITGKATLHAREAVHELYSAIIQGNENLAIRERRHEQLGIQTAGAARPLDYEQVRESLTFHEALRLFCDIEESATHPILVHDHARHWDVSRSTLMEMVASVASLPEEVLESSRADFDETSLVACSIAASMLGEMQDSRSEIPENLIEAIAVAVLRLLG